MRQLTYTLQFTTPAFLGNAEQNAQWRTPPIKALLRQWWRVAYAAEYGFNVNIPAMRREEGLLFGNAWLSHREGDRDVADHCKSQVRIRLERWDMGKLTQWQPLATVTHPEVGQAIGSDLYLGYGPLTLRGGPAPRLKANAAIQAAESATLSIAIPDAHAPRLERALLLMNHYGTLGGRSRNGWGSFSLLPRSPGAGEGALPLRPWRDCLNLDWPHAIGQDDRGALIWQTQALADWKAVMQRLAVIKIGLRTQFKFPNALPPHPQPLPRHWLSYPITRHTTRAFDRNARLPNSLRFKVRKTPDGKLVGVMFHVPHLPPQDFRPDRQTIAAVWQQVHRFLDSPTQTLTRITE